MPQLCLSKRTVTQLFRLEPMSVSSESVVATGKHAGSSYGAVAGDRGYCYWVLTATACPRNLLPFKRWLKREYGGVIPCGKHKFKFYSEVHRDAPEYCIWVCDLADPSCAMRDFQAWCIREREEAAGEDRSPEPPPSKRVRDDEPHREVPSSWACRICFDSPMQVVFLPCKHFVCCDACAQKSEMCPICRREVSRTMRVYAG